MPRKTRKQKERAQKRGAESPAMKDGEDASSMLVKREFHFSANDFLQPREKSFIEKKFDKSLFINNARFVGRDILKTTIIALIIFGLETVLYFAWFKQARF